MFMYFRRRTDPVRALASRNAVENLFVFSGRQNCKLYHRGLTPLGGKQNIGTGIDDGGIAECRKLS